MVIKVGGSLMKDGVPEELVSDAAALSASNQLVIVHGGGDVVTDVATRLGKEQRFVVSPEGIRSRYTDKETAEIYLMVMSGLLSKRLVIALGRAGARGVSISGADGSLFQAKRKAKLVIVDDRGRRVAIDGGYTGRIQSVNSPLVELLLLKGYVPVVSPVAVSGEAEPLNVDGDRAAAALGAALKADAVVFATNVEGLQLDGATVGHLSPSEATAKLPTIGFGMQKKVMAAVEAVEGGVKEAIICSGRRERPVARALAHESCTVIDQR
jgi:[amino group carrier protein]-L-2-aminoadipate/L-glutamate 6-kinase